MNQQKNTETIDLGELWYVFLYHWKQVVLWALIGVLFGGGFAYLRYRTSSSAYETYQTEKKEYDRQKDQYEKLIENRKEDLSNYMDYYNDSILMRINPQNEYRSYGTASITPVETVNKSDAVNAVRNDITSDNFLNQTAKANNTSLRYLRELLSIGTNDNGDLYVQVIGPNHSLTRNIYKAIQDEVASISDPNYTCSLPDPTNDQRMDSDLATRQSNSQNQINNTNTAISNAQTSLDNLKAPSAPDSRNELFLKYGLIGLIVGILLADIFLTIHYVRKQAVYNGEDLFEAFQVKDLGSFDQSRLYKFRNYGIKGFARKKLGFVTGEDLDYASSMTAINIYNFTKSGKHLIALIGEGKEVDGINQVIRPIYAELKGINGAYQLVYAKNILSSPNSRRVLGSADGAVILIRKGTTRMQTVRDELRLLDEMQMDCIGGILL